LGVETYNARLVTSSGGVTIGNQFQVGRTITGTVAVGGVTPLAGVALSAPGGSCSATNGSGQYTCLVPNGWTGSVTPSVSGYLFTPASRSYTSLAANQTAQNFSAATAYPVTGTVTLGGSPLAGVTLTPTGSAVCGPTNGSGQYLCNVPAGWTGSITPSLTGHIFSPSSRSYNAVLAAQTSQDYAATAIYQVSGTVTSGGSPLAGVAMGATNGVTCSSTNGSGQYSCTVSGGWTGSVTPSLSGYLFTPASTSYMSVGANQSAQNYVATPTLQVSGTATLNGLPLANVTLGATGGGSCSSTNSLGQFNCIVPQGWTGDLTPSGTGYTFAPTQRSYASLATSQTAQDFVAATNGSAEAMYFMHVDHLNTPRVVFDASQQLRWKWEQQEPFGVNVPDENPSALGVFEQPLRFPGQYADKETNLNYNFFRDCYDPETGRYCESDPIGLVGGVNTYAYVDGDPLSYIDPSGLYLTTVQAYCMRFPGDCLEMVGDIAQSAVAAAQQAQECVDDRVFNSLNNLAMAAGVVGGLKNVASAQNIANVARLKKKLTWQSAQSAFTKNGQLSAGAVSGSRPIIASSALNNPAVPSGYAKYSTATHASPSGPFQTHFYMNPSSRQVHYGVDYKSVFNHPFKGPPTGHSLYGYKRYDP
jgi:RHS repeat-associated protein